jgi:hypothetical protein
MILLADYAIALQNSEDDFQINTIICKLNKRLDEYNSLIDDQKANDIIRGL